MKILNIFFIFNTNYVFLLHVFVRKTTKIKITMKRILIFGILLFISSLIYSQKNYEIDTIYYDKDWKGVPEKVFANYYRVILTPKDIFKGFALIPKGNHK